MSLETTTVATTTAADNIASQESSGEPKTFSQDDVTRIATREKAEGRKSVLKELGIEDSEDTKEAIRAFLAQREAEKSDAQKATERATKAEREKAAAEASYTALQQKYDALAKGAKPETIDDLLALTRAKVTDKVDFAAALEQVKTSYPVLFTDTKESALGTGRAPAARKGGSPTATLGQRLAQARMDATNNSSNNFFKV